jgi:VanZ family protein
VAQLLGAAAGALAAWRGLPAATRRLRGAARVRALLALYAVVLAAWAWRPFRLDLSARTLAAELAAEHFIPLYALGERADLFSVADVATQCLLYLPLGVLLAAWPLGARGALRGPWPGVALALALEAGQLAVAGRYVDVTDWLVQAAGVLVGWGVARQAGYRARGVLRPTAPPGAGANPANRRGV